MFDEMMQDGVCFVKEEVWRTRGAHNIIFALAEAQPHHNARHTVDDGAELVGLTPEVVLPTEEVETTEGVDDLEASVRHHIYMPLPLTYRLIILRKYLFFHISQYLIWLSNVLPFYKFKAILE